MDAITVFDQVMSSSGPCTSAWEEVGLSALLFSLDEQALAIAGNQESSLESRRAIAGQAKSFKAAVNGSVGATSELGTAAQALVRAFKGEIDALTTRSRFAEGAFLNVYKLLREAPDPAVTVKTLASAARAAVEALDERNRALEGETLEYRRQLEAVRASAAARGASLTAEELQEERRVLRAEVAAEQVEKEQLRLQALQDAVQEELLYAQRQAEQERAAGQAELQVLQGEVERLETRAALVEEEARRAAQLEDEARTRQEQLRVLQDEVEALKTETEVLSARAAAALESEKRADRRREVAETRAQKAEQDLGSRVRELEEQTARLRREVAMGADAAQVEAMREKIGILEGIWGESDGEDQALKQRNAFEDDEDDDNDEDGHHSQGRTIDAVIGEERQTRTAERPVGGAANDYPGKSGRNGSLSGGHNDPFEDGENEQRDREAAAAAAEAGAGAGGGNKTSHDARHGRSASTGASTSAAGENPQDRAIISGADRQGFARKVAGGARVSGESGEDKDAGVDAWLISYNRRLKSELERLRGRARLAEERLRVSEEARAAESAELADRQQDVKRLEQDLVDAHQVVEAGKTMLRAFQSGPVAQQFGKLVGRGGRATGGLARRGLEEDDVLGGMEEGGMEGGEIPASEGFSAADRLLGAVKRQRERFRKQALQREREAAIAKGNAEHLARDNQQLKRENMHLYKKIRFVMSYGGKGQGMEGGGLGGGVGDSAAERSTESKYSKLYEEDLDPFREFDSQEKAARLGQMGVLDRLLFWASSAVLSNRFRRHVLLVYLLVLHSLLLLLPSFGGSRGATGDFLHVGGTGGIDGEDVKLVP